jgi:hypothetical protein
LVEDAAAEQVVISAAAANGWLEISGTRAFDAS